MKHLPAHRAFIFFFALLIMVLPAMAKDPGADQTQTSVKTSVSSDIITFSPINEYARFDLVVRGPNGIFSKTFQGFEIPLIELFDAKGIALPDGLYVFELTASPFVTDASRKALAEARAAGDKAAIRANLSSGFVHGGAFTILDGAIVTPSEEAPAVTGPIETYYEDPDGREDGSEPPFEHMPNEEDFTYFDEGEIDYDGERRDFVVNDDLIVDGSACIGFDCVDGESFGFDTIRLKEHNLRIKFDDTSTSGSYPRTDWQLRANDSSNGGLSRFSIDDTTNGRTPFTVEARAPNHSLYVDDGGRIGVRTSIPSAEIHIKEGDTPTLRLDQDGTTGFQPQTWDVAGNETNFFVRDVTNGSTLPFRIRKGSPSNQTVINETGVAIGHANATELLHLKKEEESYKALLEGSGPTIQVERNTGGTDNSHILLDLINDGQVNLRYNNNTGGTNRRWNTGVNSGDEYFISRSGTGTIELRLNSSGDLNTTGTVNGVSDVNMKQDFEPVSPEDVLAKVMDLPISSWSFKNDPRGNRHIGPMAQDFYAAFGLGADERHISFTDTSGVALSAIQGLTKMMQEMKAEMEAKIEAQAARIKELEAQLQD